MKHPKKFIAYVRVSTLKQGESGLGLEAQQASVRRYVEAVGGVLTAEFVEIESGNKSARPILVKSISLCRRHRAILLIAKIDRLARNVAFVSSLMESGIEFVAVDAPYANKLMIHILAAFAEHEREQISERTRNALAAARARGVKLGANGKVLAERNRAEAARIAELLRPAVAFARLNDAKSLAEIAASLNAQGLRTREGAEWSVGTTHRLLKRLDGKKDNIDHRV